MLLHPEHRCEGLGQFKVFNQGVMWYLVLMHVLLVD